MSNHRESVRPFPCANQPYLLKYGTYTVKWEILTQFKALTPTKLKIQATQLIKGHFGSFKTILDSCLPHTVRPSTSKAATTLAHAEVRTATQTSVLTKHKPPALYIPHLILVTDTAEIITAEQHAQHKSLYLYRDMVAAVNQLFPRQMH